MLDLARSSFPRCLALATLFAVVPPLLAAGPGGGSQDNPARMLDARVNLPSSLQSATAARPGAAQAGITASLSQRQAIAAAITGLKQTLPGLDVKISAVTGGPTAVSNKSGALTAAAPAVGNEEIVRGFLRENSGLYGLSAADLGDLVVLGDSPGGTSGLRMLRMEQQIDGRPVFQGETRFLLDRDGRLMKSVGLMVPQARQAVTRFDSARLLDPATALVRLLELDGKTADPAAFKVTAGNGGRLELAAAANGFILGPVTARPVLFPLSPGLLVPAWSLVVFTAGEQDWYAIVDAETGNVLWRKGIRDSVSAHDARFRVYVQADGVTPSDSPAPQSPNTATAGQQFPEIQPTIVSMHTAMSATASPNGWIDDCPGGVCTANQTQTLGNNVLACLDRLTGGDSNICDTDAGGVIDGNGRPTGNPDANSRNRDFLGTAPRDFQTGYLPPPQGGNPEAGQTATGAGANGTNALDQFRRGSITNQFYVGNWYHDKLYALGFDEASANFQSTNFSGMGLGGDRVLMDIQDSGPTGTSVNNANFGTPPDGTSGRAQMFRFTGPTIDRDGGLDNEILIHELSHGTSNRLVGNASGLNWDPARGMGEGWSDFYALSLLNNTNADTPTGRFPSGAYGTYKLGGLLDNYTYGIRRFPYTTDNTVNPMTWADVDDVTNNLSGGSLPGSPLSFNLNGGMEVHNSGEIWALTLWEVRGRIIADPAGANGNVPAGNQTMLELVTDGLKMTPIDPGFLDGRDAILDADCATNACANEESIWGGFADRGLGYDAQAPYNVMFGFTASHLGIRESFSSPFLDVVNPLTDVTINDSASNNNGAIDAGEAVQLTVKLTNPWRAAGKAVTGATATLTTLTPGVSIFDNTSTYGAIAPQGSATGDSFLITLDTTVPCGSVIDFTLSTTSNLGTTSTTFQLRVGNRNGTDPVVTYTKDPNPDVAIPDNRGRGIFDTLSITDDFEIADVNLRVDSITHTFTGDLTFMLHSPGNIGVDFLALIGAVTDGGAGANIANMVIDDDVPAIATNDMVQAFAASAPFTKSWVPAFNGPWALAGFGAPEDPVGNFSRFDGTSTKGTWTAEVSDQGPADTGTLNAWSMLVTPRHFDCSAFAPAANVTATKTVAGTFSVGGTVTYTVTLTNNGTDNQTDNAGNEFTDTLPAGLTLVSATATSGAAATSVNTVTWNGSLAPLGGSVTITITATINAGTQGATITNQGTASFDGNNDNVNEASNLTDDPGVGGAADPTSFVVGGATLTVTKTAGGTFTPNSNVTYTIVIANSGASPANGVTFTDVVPASLTVTGASSVSAAPAPTFVGNTVSWTGNVPAGGSVTITITATIKPDSTGTVSNQATVSYDADLNGSNETTVQSDDPAAAGAANPTQFVIVPGAVAVIPTLSEIGLALLSLSLLLAAMTLLRRRKAVA